MTQARSGWLLALLLLLLCPLVSLAQSHDDAAASPNDAVPPPQADEASPLAREQEKAASEALVGVWRATIGQEQVRLTLQADGQFALNDLSGRYERLPGELHLHVDSDSQTPGRTLVYQYQFVNRQLELAGGDLEGPVQFIRQFSLAMYLAELFNTDVEDIWQRVNRIGFILAVVVAARLLIGLVRLVTHALIFSNWGPLAMLYRRRKNRAKTIHSIVLNLVKYFIYFTALGMMMNELGVNYMTYIASLSVVGLAIGFGSQGLVQDMVTGFFIIFEGQFDVGDMVEISGQSGYVVELGLRMTKIRNYFGQIVVIPNRNIALVGNYSRGAQRAYIDVQVASNEDALNAMPVMRKLGEEMLKQFEGVALGPLRVTGPYPRETGEIFVRLHISIWPNQIWLINEQVIPRLREALVRAEIEPVNDRISAFYHARETPPVHPWPQRLPWRGRSRGESPSAEQDAGAGV